MKSLSHILYMVRSYVWAMFVQTFHPPLRHFQTLFESYDSIKLATCSNGFVKFYNFTFKEIKTEDAPLTSFVALTTEDPVLMSVRRRRRIIYKLCPFSLINYYISRVQNS